MPYSCGFLFFLLFVSASAFAQDTGIIQCKPGNGASVPAFNDSGKPYVVAQLTCGQAVRVLGVDRSFSPLSYSSRPAEYLIIQLDENLGYVDSRFIRLLKPGETPDVMEDEKAVSQKDTTPREEERQKWSGITKDNIIIRDEVLLKPIILNGRIYMRTFKAFLTNKGASPISNINLLVRIYDCTGMASSDYSNCEIVGEAKSIASISVPAGQSRRVEVPATFDAIPQVRDTMAWSYQILGVRTE